VSCELFLSWSSFIGFREIQKSSWFDVIIRPHLGDTAKSRCQNVITDCRRQGVDSNLITAYYDLEIDKQCISYERSLSDANDQMKQTIRNATNVLQQARLMVSQNKNRFDLKGCVNALDACMTDDFVCGSDYVNCLDTTGSYIVNGEIVLDSEVTITKLTTKVSNDNDNSMAGFQKLLKDKIGKIEDKTGRAVGMCSSIMNQCQNYSFKDGKYNEDITSPTSSNMVLAEYLDRTIRKIRVKQQEIVVAYGESCRQDIISCFTKNGATSTAPSTAQTTVINACRAYLTTCAAVNNMTAFSGDIASYVCPVGTTCADGIAEGVTLNSNSSWQCGCVCPANSTYTATATTAAAGTASTQGVPFKYCKCNNKGIVAIGGACPA
jgi:hypothetical protein